MPDVFPRVFKDRWGNSVTIYFTRNPEVVGVIGIESGLNHYSELDPETALSVAHSIQQAAEKLIAERNRK